MHVMLTKSCDTNDAYNNTSVSSVSLKPQGRSLQGKSGQRKHSTIVTAAKSSYAFYLSLSVIASQY